MILIADSGSTKTDWRLMSGGDSVQAFKTAGFNPYFQTSGQIQATITTELLPQLETTDIREIHFYGAGCSTEQNRNLVREGMGGLFPEAQIHVGHDLLAAAHALCKREPGIACILGTGVNACLYNGIEITESRPSLGFWLGDEGGGGWLGKTLVQHYFHGEMPAELASAFTETYSLTLPAVLENAYKKPFPNSYFAGFSRFLSGHLHHDYARQLIYDGFALFFDRYVGKFAACQQYPVSFTGSVAFHYREILQKAAADKKMTLKNVLASPIDGLVDYHRNR